MATKRKKAVEPPNKAGEGHKIGYSRVSTSEQDFRLQDDALIAVGVDPRDIWREKKSGGSVANRDEFQDMLRNIQPGGTIYVWKLDRLARSLKDLIDTEALITEKGAYLSVITMPAMDTSTAMGRMLFGIFGAVAEFERGLANERTLAGLAAARARGKFGGRTSAYTDEQVLATRHLPLREAVKVIKMSKQGYIKRLATAVRRSAERKVEDEQA